MIKKCLMKQKLFDKNKAKIIFLEYLDLECERKCSIQKLKKDLGKNFTRAKDWLECRKYIKKEKSSYLLTKKGINSTPKIKEGFNLDMQNKILMKQNCLTKLLVITSILLAVVAYQQYSLSQNESIPNEASLEIFLDRPTNDDVLSIPIFSINRIQKQEITLLIVNKGRIPSGPINAILKEDWLQEDYGYIENVPPAGFGHIDLNLKNRFCESSLDCPKLDSEFEPGLKKLKVLITCNTCKQKEEFRVFNLCFINEKFSKQDCLKGNKIDL